MKHYATYIGYKANEYFKNTKRTSKVYVNSERFYDTLEEAIANAPTDRAYKIYEEILVGRQWTATTKKPKFEKKA